MNDYTRRSLFETAFSYERPAQMLANALMHGMIAEGFTEREALSLLHSKAYRWALDWSLGAALEKLGIEHGKQLARDYRGDEWTKYDLPEHKFLTR
jgi:uncharacterized protein YdaT